MYNIWTLLLIVRARRLFTQHYRLAVINSIFNVKFGLDFVLFWSIEKLFILLDLSTEHCVGGAKGSKGSCHALGRWQVTFHSRELNSLSRISRSYHSMESALSQSVFLYSENFGDYEFYVYNYVFVYLSSHLFIYWIHLLILYVHYSFIYIFIHYFIYLFIN